MLYPLKFEPVYKNIIWGGRNLEKVFGRNLPAGDIGESWELCCRPDGMSIVSNGFLKGKSIEEVINKYELELLGQNIIDSSFSQFPLLIKIIDANDKLSVQVHPDDEYARINENGEYGKTEMWYVIDSKPGAGLIYGIKEGMNKDEFMDAISSGKVKECLKEVSVKPGDVFYIPSGTVHAILDGILIAEIQQNSNTTYRLYDWDRVDKSGNSRELHIKKALDVIDFKGTGKNFRSAVIEENDLVKIKQLTRCKYFTVEEISLNGVYETSADNTRFYIYMVINGKGTLNYDTGTENLQTGETLMIPASLGKYNINGNIKLLKIYV